MDNEPKSGKTVGQLNLERFDPEDIYSDTGDNWKVPCPVGGGSHLSIDVVTNKISDFKQHDWNEVARGLLRWGVLPQYYVTRYEYTDEDGKKLFVHGKRRPREQGKASDWTHGYDYRKNGVPVERKGKGATDGIRRVLFDLPLVKQSPKVWIAAGEKDAELLRHSFKKNATTRPFGELHWDDGYFAQLEHATSVTIVVDNDDAGYRGGWTVYSKLQPTGVKLRVLRPIDEAKDVFDHVHSGHTLDELQTVDLKELEERGSKPKKQEVVERASAGPMSPELASLTDSLGSKLTTEQLNPRDIAKHLWTELNGLYYLSRSGEWRRWNGYCYENCETELRARIIPATVEVSRNRLLTEAASADPKGGMQRILRQREYSFSRGGFPRELISLLSDFCFTDDERFDGDSTVLACESGILDREAAKQGEIAFLPHDSSRMITKYMPFAYDPDATCLEWLDFLQSSTLDGGRRLRMLIGFALCGDVTKKKHIVNLIGPPDTGKSTCLDILNRIIGCYLGTMRTDEITVSRNNAKFDFHGLRNSRAVFLSEPEPRSRFRVSDLKRITGGEELTTEGKGTKQVKWRASVMPFIGTNFHINFDTRDDAFSDRLEYLEFVRTRDIDRQLKKKLERELTGIFGWVLQGALDYFAGGLEESAESIAAKRRAESAIEPPLQFIEYGLREGLIHLVPEDYPSYKCCAVGKLYTAFCEWWHDENPEVKPYGRKRFSDVLQKRYPTTDKSSGGGLIKFTGIAPGPDHR